MVKFWQFQLSIWVLYAGIFYSGISWEALFLLVGVDALAYLQGRNSMR